MTTPISPLPTPPSPTDSPVDFNTKAFALLGALPAFVTEANAQASGLDAAVVAAETEADAAALKASEALTSANNAAISKTGADSARDDAVIAKNAAEAALDSFDDRYLGAKAVAPTTDNDGGALLPGALYWDTVLGAMRAWSGSAWVTLSAATAAAISNTPDGAITATTVQGAINELDAKKANLASPALTGAPTAPTAAVGTNTTQIATTAFVNAGIASVNAAAISNTPSGSIAATTVQGAINELAEIKVDLAAATGASLVGYMPAGGSAVPRTAQSKLREIVSVADFGAKCDGVTNDWAAIQAAQEYLKANGGGTLYFPGWCYIDAPFYFYGSVTNGWVGNPAYPIPNRPMITWASDGQHGIRAGMASGDVLRLSKPSTTTLLQYNIGFKDFAIDCNQKEVTAVNGQSCDGSGGSGTNHYVEVNGLVIQGIQGASAVGFDCGSITDSKIRGLSVQSWGTGAYAGIVLRKTDVQLLECHFVYNIHNIVVGNLAEACIQMFGGSCCSPKRTQIYWESPTADYKSSASVITGAFIGETNTTATYTEGPILRSASPSNLDIGSLTFVGCMFDNWTASPNLMNIEFGGRFTFVGCETWADATGNKTVKFGANCHASMVNNGFSVDPTGSAVALGNVKEPLTYAQNVAYAPVFSAGGSTFAYAADGQKGYYTKIGNTVTLTMRVQLAASGSSLAANQLSVSLPIAAANNAYQRTICTVGVLGATANLYTASGLIQEGTSQVDLYKTAAAQASFVGAPLLANDLGASGGIYLTTTYFSSN